MRSIKNHIVSLLMLLCMLPGMELMAQTFPATVNTVVKPPYSVYLSDYISIDSDKIMTTLIFNDFNEPSWDVRLNFKLEGNGITIETKPDYLPPPISLTPGVPEVLFSSDLSNYFNFSNLNFSGTSPAELNTNGRLEEGMYSFCFTIIDYNSGKPISLESCANVWLILKEPPFVITPVEASFIQPMEPLNIPFQWQVVNDASPNSMMATEYQLTVFEILENNADPKVAVLNNQALQIFQSEWDIQTRFIYDISAALLDLGKKYAFYIQARDTEGRDLYKNDGISEISWFMYGYPEGGTISLNYPEDGSSFKVDDVQNFGWSEPDNTVFGQQYVYKLKIVEVQEGQDPETALINNPSWYDYESPTYASAVGANILLGQPLETQKNYAWQVEAHSGAQTVASSEIFTFAGPPIIEQFRAGEHVVSVTSTDSDDLSNLSGKGIIALDEEGTETIEVSFENINVGEAGGLYFLQSGTITHDLDPIKEIKITAIDESNGTATFYGSAIQLDKDELKIQGYAEWPFSHPVSSGDQALITTQTDWLNFDKFELKGRILLNEENSFDLLEPFGYTMALDATSDLNIDYNDFTPTLNGKVILPEDIKGESDGAVEFSFRLTNQLFYFDADGEQVPNDIKLVQNTGIIMHPNRVIFDFSEDDSPAKFSSNQDWKGLYFETFDLYYKIPVDDGGQLVFAQQITHDFELTAFNETKAWADSRGLTFYVDDRFSTYDEATFNTFPTNLKSFTLDIFQGTISSSDLKGSIKLPVIDDSKNYKYTIPITESGFMDGFLDVDLEEKTFVFNAFSEENRVDVTIKRAVFANNERMDLTLDIEIPYISAKIPSIHDFRIYGDYTIGFAKKQGAIDLDQQVEANFRTFTMFIDKIGASLINGRYTFSYSATMPLGEEISGDEGPPRLNFHSISPGSDELMEVSRGRDASDSDMPPPISGSGEVAGNAKEMKMDSMAITVESAIVDLTGYLKMTRNDPDWGDSFQGGINGQIKIPTEIGAGANMILGNKEGLKYWYFDAWFVDSEGMGLNVFNMFNLVGFEGKIYRHMRMDPLNSTNPGGPQVVVDPDIEFGAGLYIQMIDNGGGKMYMVDVGAELEVTSEGFIIQMNGDISALNSQGRNINAAAALKQEIAETVAEEAASAVMDAIGPIEVDIPVGGGKELHVVAKSDGGSLGYSDGGTSVSVAGDVSETPEVTFNLTSGNQSITVSGSADARGSLDLQDGSKRLALEVAASGEGSLDFQYDNVGINLAVNREEQSGALGFSIDDTSFDLEVNKQEQYGKLDIASGETALGIELDQGAGSLSFRHEESTIDLNGNSSGTKGYLKLANATDQLELGVDTENRSAMFGLVAGNKSINIAGSPDGGTLGFTFNDFTYSSTLDRPTGSGSLAFSYGSSKSLALSGNKNGQANLEAQYDDTNFNLDVDKSINKYFIGFENKSLGRIYGGLDGSLQSKQFGFIHGNDSVTAYFQPDSSQLMVAYKEEAFGLGLNPDAQFMILKHQDNNLLLRRYTAGGGAVDIRVGESQRYYLDINQGSNEKAAVIQVDNFRMAGTSSPSETSFEVNYDDYRAAVLSSAQTKELTLQKAENSFTINQNSVQFAANNNQVTITRDPSVELEIDGRSLVMKYDPSAPNKITITDEGNLVSYALNNSGLADKSYSLGSATVSFRILSDNYSAILSQSGIDFTFTITDGGAVSLGVTGWGAPLLLSKDGNRYAFSISGNELYMIPDEEIGFNRDNLGFSITPQSAAFNYDQYQIAYQNQGSFTYQDDNNSFDLSRDALEVSRNGNIIRIGADKTLNYTGTDNTSIAVSTNSLEFTYDQYDFAISREALNYSDNSRELSVGTDNFSYSQDNKSASVDFSGGNPVFQIADGDRSIYLSDEQVKLADGEDYFAIGGDYMVEISYDQYLAQLNSGYLSLAMENRSVAFGGDDYFSIIDGDRSLSFSKDKAISLTDGDLSLGLTAEKVATLSKGNRSFVINEDDTPIRYIEGDVEVGLVASSGTYGVEVQKGEIGASLTTEKFKNATLGFSSSFGAISVTGDSKNNITADFTKNDRTISITAGDGGISLNDSDNPEDEGAPDVAQVGTPTPEPVGPQYIGKVTDGADGRVKGSVSLYYNSIEKHLIANGSVSAVGGPCLQGSFGIEATPDTWQIDIGSEQDRIEVFPTCSGFGGGGWLSLNPGHVNVGVFVGFSAGGEVKLDWGIGWAKIWARIYAELGIKADADLTPVFVINEVGIWVYLYAGLGVDYDIGIDKGSFTLAEAELKGELLINFESGTNVSGKLEGKITIIGISGKFKLGFNENM